MDVVQHRSTRSAWAERLWLLQQSKLWWNYMFDWNPFTWKPSSVLKINSDTHLVSTAGKTEQVKSPSGHTCCFHSHTRFLFHDFHVTSHRFSPAGANVSMFIIFIKNKVVIFHGRTLEGFEPATFQQQNRSLTVMVNCFNFKNKC